MVLDKSLLIESLLAGVESSAEAGPVSDLSSDAGAGAFAASWPAALG